MGLLSRSTINTNNYKTDRTGNKVLVGIFLGGPWAGRAGQASSIPTNGHQMRSARHALLVAQERVTGVAKSLRASTHETNNMWDLVGSQVLRFYYMYHTYSIVRLREVKSCLLLQHDNTIISTGAASKNENYLLHSTTVVVVARWQH